MSGRSLETDYLVVGCGAAGMAFADSLIAACGFVEATRGEDAAAKNRLCPVNPLPHDPIDWVRGTLIGMNADYLWSKEPDIAAWLEGARLTLSRGLRNRMGEPQVQAASKRYAENARLGLAKLAQFAAAPR